MIDHKEAKIKLIRQNAKLARVTVTVTMVYNRLVPTESLSKASCKRKGWVREGK